MSAAGRVAPCLARDFAAVPFPFGFELFALDLGVLVGGLDQGFATGPAEDPGDEDDGEDDAPGGDDQLLADRVGGGGRGVDGAREGSRVHRLGDADAAGGGGDAVGDRVGGGDGGDVVEADRDPVGPEEDGDDRQPGGVAAELWQDQVGKGAA